MYINIYVQFIILYRDNYATTGNDIYGRRYYFDRINKYAPHFSNIIKCSPEYDISFPKLMPVCDNFTLILTDMI